MVDKTEKNDKDSIDSLSLLSMPLSSTTLKNARLVKNSRLETTVELYNDPISGSLQIMPSEIEDAMKTTERDQEIIRQLASLNSYDVYSLRTSLKKIGVEIADPDALVLSPEMKESLTHYSYQFTRPLVEKIFGTGRVEINSKEGLQKIFRDPDIMRIRENLKIMTEKTGIPLAEIPKFLEEYSDVFLSVSYYRFSFDAMSADLSRYLEWSQAMRTHKDVSSSPKTAASCKMVEDSLRFLSGSIRERLIKFQSCFELFWADINQESFHSMRAQIEENHSSMGSVLCGLSIKMKIWSKEFPDNIKGGPTTRSKFVVTDLEPGLLKLRDLELEARKKLGMTNPKL
jgi:hypothetical protein